MATSHENSDGIVLVRDEKVVHSQDFNASFLFFYSRARFLLTDRRIVTERPKGLWEIITRGSEIESVPLAQISSVGMHRGTRGWAIIVWIIGLSMIIGGLFDLPTGLISIVIGALIIMVFGFTSGIRVNTTGG